MTSRSARSTCALNGWPNSSTNANFPAYCTVRSSSLQRTTGLALPRAQYTSTTIEQQLRSVRFLCKAAFYGLKGSEEKQRQLEGYTMSLESVRSIRRIGTFLLITMLLLHTRALAQSPWERAASRLELSFTGPLARSLALVSIVIGGLLFMFGEGGAKRQISGIVFGGGLALFATQFLTWLF